MLVSEIICLTLGAAERERGVGRNFPGQETLRLRPRQVEMPLRQETLSSPRLFIIRDPFLRRYANGSRIKSGITQENHAAARPCMVNSFAAPGQSRLTPDKRRVGKEWVRTW